MDFYNKRVLKSVIFAFIFLIVFTLLLNALFFRHEEGLVYVTDTGDCYHALSCHYLKSINAIGIDKAKAQGYSACSYCHGKYVEQIVVNNYGAAFGITIVILLILGPIAFATYMGKDATNKRYSEADVKYSNGKYYVTHEQTKEKLRSFINEQVEEANKQDYKIETYFNGLSQSITQRIYHLFELAQKADPNVKIKCSKACWIFLNPTLHKIYFAFGFCNNGINLIPGVINYDEYFSEMDKVFHAFNFSKYQDGMLFIPHDKEYSTKNIIHFMGTCVNLAIEEIPVQEKNNSKEVEAHIL